VVASGRAEHERDGDENGADQQDFGRGDGDAGHQLGEDVARAPLVLAVDG
jgi:hypothetical protein